MSGPAAGGTPPAPAAQTFTVRVQLLSWVTSFVGGSGGGTLEFDEEIAPEETLRDLLLRFSARYPKLHEALWHPGTSEMGAHIEIAINDAILDLTHTLDSHLQPGDRVLLMGQYLGG